MKLTCATHMGSCREQNMPACYVVLLDIEFNRHLSELAATSTQEVQMMRMERL